MLGLSASSVALAQNSQSMTESTLESTVESVTVVRFENVALAQQRETSASVESLDQAVIAAEVAARIIDIPVKVGETVEAGRVLVRLEKSDYQLGLDAAQAGLELASAGQDMARLRAERARRLAPDQFVSEDQLLEAETRLRQTQAERALAEVELRRAELLLSRTEITSPYDAVIQAQLTGSGALAVPGTPLLELVATNRLEITSGIATGLIDGLVQAEQMEFRNEDDRYAINLLRISPLVSPGARQREARFEFIDARPAPGSQGTVAWTDPRPVLPADFVVLRGDQLGVLTVDADRVVGSTAEVRFLALPKADAGRPVPVDLAPDTLLLAEGRRRVQPGDTVSIDAERP